MHVKRARKRAMSEGKPRTCSCSHPSESRLRVVLIGNSGVGKSSFLAKFVDNTFDVSLIKTIGIDFKTKAIKIDGRVVQLNIWDTAGQERFWSVTPAYCRNSDGIFLIYDITDMKSFEDISFWVDKLYQHAPTDVGLMLLGSKLDLAEQRVVMEDMGKEEARKIKAAFSEVSAVTGENIERAIESFVRSILNRQSIFAVQESSGVTSPDCSGHGDVVQVRPEGRNRRNSFGSCCYQSSVLTTTHEE